MLFTEIGLRRNRTALSLVQVFHRIWLKLLQRRYSYRLFSFSAIADLPLHSYLDTCFLPLILLFRFSFKGGFCAFTRKIIAFASLEIRVTSKLWKFVTGFSIKIWLKFFGAVVLQPCFFTPNALNKRKRPPPNWEAAFFVPYRITCPQILPAKVFPTGWCTQTGRFHSGNAGLWSLPIHGAHQGRASARNVYSGPGTC